MFNIATKCMFLFICLSAFIAGSSQNSMSGAVQSQFVYKGVPVSPRPLYEFMNGPDSVVDLNHYPFDGNTYRDYEYFTKNQKDSFYILNIEELENGFPHAIELAYKVIGKTTKGKFLVLWRCIAGTNLNYHFIKIIDLRDGKLFDLGTLDYDFDHSIEFKNNIIINGTKHLLIPD